MKILETQNINVVKIEECLDSPYIKPQRVHYTENGIKKTWDFICAHDSVSILIFDKSLQSTIIVKQMRPALFLKEGIVSTYELCAGIVDKQKSLEEIASEEVFEECGYKIFPHKLVKICSFCSSVGFAASRQHLYYAEVNSAMKLGKGGGVETENIEIVSIPLEQMLSFIYNDQYSKTSGLMFAFLWFLQRDVGE